MKLTDSDRARIALGWAESGLPQDEYAAQFGLSGRSIRKWRSRLVADRNPMEQVEAVLVETIAVLQALLASVRAQRGSAPEHAERDGHLDQLAVPMSEAGCSARFRPEQPEVGTDDRARLLDDIIEVTKGAIVSEHPTYRAAHDRPEQHPVEVAGQHSTSGDDLARVPDGLGQSEPADSAPMPLPGRRGKGFFQDFE